MPMPVDKITQIKKLVRDLNYYRYQYYNNDFSVVEDVEYDKLFDKLKTLEEETGFIMTNSPTRSVGYTVQSKLKKVTHNHPMLSLGKSTDWNDIIKWADGEDCVCSLKLDGLTVSILYNSDGFLERAETRGNGEVGEDITENIKCVSNVPLRINTYGKELIVDGEMIVKLNTFKKLNVIGEFSHPRNYASGSIRQLDTNITKQRELSFIAWKYVEGYNKTDYFDDNLFALHQLGFEVVPFTILSKRDWEVEYLEKIEAQMRQDAEDYFLPIDGLVVTINDIQEGEKRGSTAHHPNHSMAFKFYQESNETVLRDIEWNVGKSGIVAPTAIFDPIIIDGSEVGRATLHNISYIKSLELGIGDTITVIKANQIIPRVVDNITRSNNHIPPTNCPCCGEELEQRTNEEGDITLYCNNPDCPAKNLAKFTQFVSKAGANIDGLSESKLEKLIDKGLIHTFKDIYHLKNYSKEIQTMKGFGKKSYDKLIESIENSRNIKLENYLVALSIPNVGKTAAKTISKYFNGNYEDFITAFTSLFDFSTLKDFGPVINESLYKWFEIDPEIEGRFLQDEFNFIIEEQNDMIKSNDDVIESDFCNGKTFVITGKFSKPRSYYEEFVESHGGKLSGSVSKKTDYLLTDDPDSGSTKAKKAKELGIPVLSEQEFLEKGGIND